MIILKKIIMSKKITTQQFIEKAKQIHGNKYSYAKTNYINSTTKVCIICPKHGEFWQLPQNHFKYGCKECGNESTGKHKRKSTEEFIEQSIKIHNNRYDYSKVEYKTKNDKVCIICPEHGEFWQIANNHLKGHGCPKCGIKITSNAKLKSTEEFIKSAKLLYGEMFDYSKVNYINTKTPVCIICHALDENGKEHGEFWQTPQSHLSGRKGCLKCKSEKISNSKKSNTDDFIKKANKIHLDKYDYSKVNYTSAHSKVTIICPEHGEFEQTPNHHLNGQGCPICKSSKGELLVKNILTKYKIPFKSEVTYTTNEIVRNKKEFRIDFVITLNNHLYFIEYNGIQHYKPIEYFGGKCEFELQQKRDNYVRNFVLRHSDKISLLELNYKLKEKTVEEKIIKFLKINQAPINSDINSKSDELLGNLEPES